MLVEDRGRSVVRLRRVDIGRVGRIVVVLVRRRRVGTVSTDSTVAVVLAGLGVDLSPTDIIHGLLFVLLGASVTNLGSSTGQ